METNILFIIHIFVSLYIFIGIFMMYDLYSKNKILKKLILNHNLNNDIKLVIPYFINKEYGNLLLKTAYERKLQKGKNK